MQGDEIARRVEAHGDKIREHEAAIAVLTQRANDGERDRKALWRRKENHDDKIEALSKRLEEQHRELMAAITANKTAASIIAGERGAGKWILGFIATVFMALVGLVSLLIQGIQWFFAH